MDGGSLVIAGSGLLAAGVGLKQLMLTLLGVGLLVWGVFL